MNHSIKHCTNSRTATFERIITWVSCLAVNALFLPSAVMVAGTASIVGIVTPIFLTLMALVWMTICIVNDLMEWRKYSIDEAGITIVYCNHFKKFYSWKLFRKIVVCDVFHAGKDPGICRLVIRLAAFDEEYGPLSAKRRYAKPHIDRWRGGGYTLFRFRKIIYITFSPERLEEIQQMSHLRVMYSLTPYGKEAYEAKKEAGEWYK